MADNPDDKVVDFRKRLKAGGRLDKLATFKEKWDLLGLPRRSNSVQPLVNLDTAVRVLQGMEVFKDLHFDTFLHRCRIGEMTLEKAQELEVTLYMQREIGLHDMKHTSVELAIYYTARQNPRNCVQNWLDALPPWDGVRRLNRFFMQYFGAEDSQYTSAVGINFFRSIVARILWPGCMSKYMVVLEGPQDIGKSYAIQALCPGPMAFRDPQRKLSVPSWFATLRNNLESKDAMIGLQGKLLIEVPELDAFIRSDPATIKAFVGEEVDWYRGVYDKENTDHPRQCIMVGTTNHDDWNRDETGAVRFWPILCRFVLIDALKEAAQMLYAEALADVKAGLPWWEMPGDEARIQQDARFLDHPWRVHVETYCFTHQRGVTIEEVMEHSNLRLEPRFQDKKAKLIILQILKRMGWVQKRSSKRRWWEPADREPGEDG